MYNLNINLQHLMLHGGKGCKRIQYKTIYIHSEKYPTWYSGRGDRDGEYMHIQGWFMSMYDKNHYNIVK